jgi:hypothetical protein
MSYEDEQNTVGVRYWPEDSGGIADFTGSNTLEESWWNPSGTGEFDTARWDASEITNTVTTPGEEGYGWRYFTDGTAISPDGKYYSGGSLVYDPGNQAGFWGGVSSALGTKAANALKSKIMTHYGALNPHAQTVALTLLPLVLLLPASKWQLAGTRLKLAATTSLSPSSMLCASRFSTTIPIVSPAPLAVSISPTLSMYPKGMRTLCLRQRPHPRHKPPVYKLQHKLPQRQQPTHGRER